ncbi:MAG: Rieske 2Fe-2S domain-containing protein [Gammaproteobacteria bacterium]|jgi:3-phenylpropionate/trans-cinnamate dioxygenase ferredoxin subunit|nr:Rieske 2Fe-2S domain-containing protein [Gammaproteobacteria bacterium]
MTRDTWIDVGALADLETAGHLDTEIDDLPVTIVRVADRLHAFEDRCTHDGASLAGAEIDPDGGPAVICPRHGARFCLRTGAALTPPAYEPIRVFEARERDGRIELRCP